MSNHRFVQEASVILAHALDEVTRKSGDAAADQLVITFSARAGGTVKVSRSNDRPIAGEVVEILTTAFKSMRWGFNVHSEWDGPRDPGQVKHITFMHPSTLTQIHRAPVFPRPTGLTVSVPMPDDVVPLTDHIIDILVSQVSEHARHALLEQSNRERRLRK